MTQTNKLQLFEIIEKTVLILEENQPLYTKAVYEITEKLKMVLSEYGDELMDIHTRIKSPVSLKEKIIRNKLYRMHDSPQEILDNLSDLIGIMVKCRFNKNEVELFNIIRKHFFMKSSNGMCYSPDMPKMLLDLDSQQPQIQKNGHEIFRIDGQYICDGKKVNFELQIKSLVNTFWSEIEHKVVYKNNIYIPNHGYIMEMLSAIKGNLIGIDKMLQLVNDQILDLSAGQTGAHFDINSVIAKLISDTFISKMSESIGFTVDFKRICDLIGGYLISKYKNLPINSAQIAFLDLVHRFNEIYERKINWEQNLYLEQAFIGEDKFCQILGDRLISYMNIDFEWHIFFLMLFQIESDNNNLESFSDFINTLRNNYSDRNLYKELYTAFDKASADKIYDEVTEFLAYALSATASINIIDNNNEETAKLISETTSYIIKSFKSYDDFRKYKKAVQMMILEKWRE